MLYVFYVSSNEMWTSLVAQLAKNLPAMQETWIRSMGQEGTLEKEMATHFHQCACLGDPMDRKAWRATVHGITKSQTRLGD